MAKAGFWLKGARGKLNGASIAGAAGGGTVIRAIAKPTNPQTESQTETRSKFKLISQLGAALKGVIAIKRDGALSGRNQFNSINFPAASYNMAGEAVINLNSVQLTKSNTALGGFNADRSGTATVVMLNASAAGRLDRVCYIQFEKLDDGSLLHKDSVVVNAAGNDGLFEGALGKSDKAVVIYAYGMKDNNGATTEIFGNMSAPTAEEIAKVVVSSKIGAGDVSFTKTDGLTMLVGEDTADSDDVEHLTVSLVISGNGSATGGGRFEAGQQATLRATPDAEAEFDGFYLNNASGQLLSTNNPYSFTVQENMTVCAKFHGGPTPTYGITVSADPANAGTVTGGGNKAEGESCTVVATPASGKVFSGWYENNALVSGSASYTFTVERARNLVARFADAPESMILSIKRNGSTDIVNNSYVEVDVNYVGAFASEANGKEFAAVYNGTAPAVGATVSAHKHAAISGGAATLSELNESGSGRCYFVVGTMSGSSVTIEEVFPVSLQLTNDDESGDTN